MRISALTGRLAVAVAVAGLALAGCSTPTGGGTATGHVAPAGQATGGAAKSGGTGQGGGTGVQAPLQSGALPVLATHDVGGADATASVDLNEVRVSGKLLQVTFTVHNNGSDSWLLQGVFADGITQADGPSVLTTDPVDGYSTDGVYLIDPVNAKRYLAARAADGACACSADLGEHAIPANGSLVLSVQFAAPPAGVDAVDVHIPGTAPFTAAPVGR